MIAAPPPPSALRRRHALLAVAAAAALAVLSASFGAGGARVRSLSRTPAPPPALRNASSASASASDSSAPLLAPIVLPNAWQLWQHADRYDTWLFSDLFLRGDTIHVVACVYVRMKVPLQRLRLRVPLLDEGGGGGSASASAGAAAAASPLREFDEWLVRDEYESVVLGFLRDARLAAPGVRGARVVAEFMGEERDFWLPQLACADYADACSRARSPPAPSSASSSSSLALAPRSKQRLAPPPPFQPPRRAPDGPRDGGRGLSRFGMCALFHTDAHLLEAWAAYWWLLGVEHFYLYFNGAAADIPALQARAAALRGSFHFAHWPFDYWVADKIRPHHGQPMMLNDCFYRNRDRHELLLMYDLDEALVFRAHVDLHAFYDSLGAPVAALRTQSAWARVDLEGIGAAAAAQLGGGGGGDGGGGGGGGGGDGRGAPLRPEALTIDSLAARPLTRAAVHYSREKYAVNTSRAAGVSLVNVHGVYQVPCAPRMTLPDTAAAQGWPQALLDEAVGFHFHFVNVGRDRNRGDRVSGDGVVEDARAAEMAQELLARRGRPERARAAAGEGGAEASAKGGAAALRRAAQEALEARVRAATTPARAAADAARQAEMEALNAGAARDLGLTPGEGAGA